MNESIGGYLPGEVMDAESVAALVATLNARIARLEAALPDPDKLLWLVEWLDKTNSVVTAYVEHHDATCESHTDDLFDHAGTDCGELGPGEKRDKLLEFMGNKVQVDLREAARLIKEAQAHG